MSGISITDQLDITQFQIIDTTANFEQSLIVTTTFISSISNFINSFKKSIKDFFDPKTVEKLAQSLDALRSTGKPQTRAQRKLCPEIEKVLVTTTSVLGNLKKKVQTEKRQIIMAQHQKILQQPSSIIEKVKSLVNIPKDLAPFVDIFMAKGTHLTLDVGLENDSLVFSTDLNLACKGVKSKVYVTLPTTAGEALDATPINLDPRLKALLGAKLSPGLSKDLDINQIVQLLLTIPSQTMNVTYVGPENIADITITLPSGATLKLEFEIPKANDAKAQGDSDAVRSFLKGILKENYAGIEPLLSETFTFIWDGATSQFNINFLQQQAVKINELAMKGKGPLVTLIEKIGKNGTLVLPKTIAGTVDFQKSSIQFEPGTRLILKDFLAFDKDIDLHQVSFDIKENTLFLSISCFGSRIIPIKLDQPKDAESPLEKLDFKFIPFNDPKAKETVQKEKQAAEVKAPAVSEQKPISVFNQIKKLIKIPEALTFYVNMLFANGTKLHAEVDIQDNVTFKTRVNIPGAGITGQASFSFPVTPSSPELPPVKMNNGLLDLVSEQLKSLTTEEDMEKLLALLTMIPSQNMHIHWTGSSSNASIIVTLPGGATLKLDLNIPKQEDSSKDVIHNFLKKILKDNYKGIASLLQQDFFFAWDASASTFKIKFAEQQVIRINSLKLKGEGFIQNLIAKLFKSARIVIPQFIEGKVDFENTSVKFAPRTRFILQGLLPFNKKITIDQVRFHPENNAIDLQIKCFGKHKATIDLNISDVESVNFDIMSHLLFIP
jgi:hypothetical protein